MTDWTQITGGYRGLKCSSFPSLTSPSLNCNILKVNVQRGQTFSCLYRVSVLYTVSWSSPFMIALCNAGSPAERAVAGCFGISALHLVLPVCGMPPREQVCSGWTDQLISHTYPLSLTWMNICSNLLLIFTQKVVLYVYCSITCFHGSYFFPIHYYLCLFCCLLFFSFIADHCGNILSHNYTPSRAEVWSETKIFVLINIYKGSSSASLYMFMTSYYLPQSPFQDWLWVIQHLHFS